MQKALQAFIKDAKNFLGQECGIIFQFWAGLCTCNSISEIHHKIFQPLIEEDGAMKFKTVRQLCPFNIY